MKVAVCLDSFKDSFDTIQINEMIGSMLTSGDKSFIIKVLPVSDGGEGVLNVLDYYHEGDLLTSSTYDPLFKPIIAEYLYNINDNTAYIEMARASGIQLLSKNERKATKTSSFGTGCIIKDAINRGARNIELYVGGSATNDAGVGMAEALGVRFYSLGNEMTHIRGIDLSRIDSIYLEHVPELLQNVDIHVNCDVNNVLLGTNGATYVYGPQKGASENDLILLESGIRTFSNLIKSTFGTDYSNILGSGAAGGIAFTVMSLFRGKIKSGTESIFDIMNLSSQLADVDVIITGEGRIDRQSMSGKLISAIASISKSLNKRLLCISALSDLSSSQLQQLGIERLFTLFDTQPTTINISESKNRLQITCNEIVTYLKEASTI